MDAQDIVLAHTFQVVAEARSVSAAAARLRVTPSAISRQIVRLEERLGVQLLVRTPRYIRVTDIGRLFLQQCRRGNRAFDAAWETASMYKQQAQGILRVWCTPAFGRRMLTPALADFLASHPKVSIELSLGYHDASMMEQGVDIAVTAAVMRGSKRLVHENLCAMPQAIVATPEFLDRGRPTSPSDLTNYNCLINIQSIPAEHWPFVWNGKRQRIHVRGNFRVDNIEGLREAVLAHVGIGILPRYLVDDDLTSGRLRHVFAALEKERPGFSAKMNMMKAYYDRSRLKDEKVATFVSHMKKHFSSDV